MSESKETTTFLQEMHKLYASKLSSTFLNQTFFVYEFIRVYLFLYCDVVTNRSYYVANIA